MSDSSRASGAAIGGTAVGGGFRGARGGDESAARRAVSLIFGSQNAGNSEAPCQPRGAGPQRRSKRVFVLLSALFQG
jgi:hypothetical protein